MWALHGSIHSKVNIFIRQLSKPVIMAGSHDQREDSLERELAYEDATVAAGKSSKDKRDESKAEKEKKAEEERQAQMKEAMFAAGKRSREKRNKS
ncbi:hypothetical protein NM208_g13527 [Fusarium decemcellulare]|uniref:Uncharacterized protein n=1 Tax=Fusarium decemcellulare TaxID=57161 RepID=A0ACC1RK43_9HYPO|nr:hypothetical protein NM208_g13527 [Fusarium decemcellulare]